MQKKLVTKKILKAAATPMTFGPKAKLPSAVSAFRTDLKYQLTPQLKSTLQKEAPETLRTPKIGEFNTKQNYQKALKKYLKHGHWATI